MIHHDLQFLGTAFDSLHRGNPDLCAFGQLSLVHIKKATCSPNLRWFDHNFRNSSLIGVVTCDTFCLS